MLKSEQPYKDIYSFQQRRMMYQNYSKIGDTKILVVVERTPSSRLPNPLHRRFNCHSHHTFGLFRSLVLEKLHQTKVINVGQAKQSMLISVRKSVPSPEMTMQQVYDMHHDEDGFLYVNYQEMEAF